MATDPIDLLREALKLSPEARAALAGSLLDSLEHEVDPEAEAEWEQEILRRLQKLDSSESKTIPWSRARQMILEK